MELTDFQAVIMVTMTLDTESAVYICYVSAIMLDRCENISLVYFRLAPGNRVKEIERRHFTGLNSTIVL